LSSLFEVLEGPVLRRGWPDLLSGYEWCNRTACCSRSRFCRLASSSAIVGTRAILQWPRSPRSQPKLALQQLGVEPVGFRPARFPRYRDTRGMEKVCLDATLTRPARQPEAVATRFKGQCIRVVGQRSICSAGQCPVGSAIFGCFMAQIIFSKAAAITIYPSENRGCHLPRGVRGSPRKARICLRLREYYRDFWQLSRWHEGSHPQRRTRKTRYPNLNCHGAASVMRFEPMRH